MEISKAIRTGYYNALFGNITDGGVILGVYDAFALPESVRKPYILLSTQTSVQQNLKRCKRYDATMLVDIVTGGPNELQGREQAENIAEQVEDIINPDSFADINIEAYGYSIGNTTRESDTDTSLQNGREYVYRKLIRYAHIVTKI